MTLLCSLIVLRIKLETKIKCLRKSRCSSTTDGQSRETQKTDETGFSSPHPGAATKPPNTPATTANGADKRHRDVTSHL